MASRLPDPKPASRMGCQHGVDPRSLQKLGENLHVQSRGQHQPEALAVEHLLGGQRARRAPRIPGVRGHAIPEFGRLEQRKPEQDPHAERFADKLRARRLAGFSMLHQCPCGGIDSFNGFMGARQLRQAHKQGFYEVLAVWHLE